MDEIPWNDETPSFNLISDDKEIINAKVHFSKRYVYYAGSHEGCGCGFFYDEEDEDLMERKESVQKFVRTIENVLKNESSVELYVTWAGDEKVSPKKRRQMKPTELLNGKEFPLNEGDFVILTSA